MVQWDSVEQLEQYQLHQRNDLPKLGTDSKLLAQFATLHRREKVLDLGCGVGVLGVLLAQRQKELTLDGIDIVPESAELAAYNLTANGLTGTIRQGDLNHCRPAPAVTTWSSPILLISLPTPARPPKAPARLLAARQRVRWRGCVRLLAGCSIREGALLSVIGQSGWRPCFPP